MITAITLNNGVKIPAIGYGVFRMKDPAECEEAVVQAIQSGYRLIDTAAAYENEEAVGRAIRRCGVPREELFITTKLWITDTSYEGAKRGFARSMERLGLDSVDLYLIHQPYNDYYGAWRALEEMYAAGKARAIGVDNFTPDKLADFVFWNKVKPAVNLVECNAFFQREEDRRYMESQNIQMQAWSPLAAGQGRLFENETLRTLAAAHNKTVAQVVLRCGASSQQGLFDSYVCGVSLVNFLAATLAQQLRNATQERLARIERLHVALNDLEPQL